MSQIAEMSSSQVSAGMDVSQPFESSQMSSDSMSMSQGTTQSAASAATVGKQAQSSSSLAREGTTSQTAGQNGRCKHEDMSLLELRGLYFFYG